MKGKGERELNVEFQRIARRDKKSLLNEQCKEIEGNNRMGKTRDLFKKTGDIKETFHAKMGTVKDRKGKDLTEAKEIKKSWQEYTKELYKKGLNDQITTVTYLEPDTLEYEVKWVLDLTANKASRDGITAELFKILKDDAVKLLHLIWQHIWKT